MLVFHENQWVDVTPPVGHDPCWVEGDMFFFAIAWLSARGKGFPKTRATQIAEALVSKRLYPGLGYDKELEGDIQSLNGDTSN
jgi:hypothetical protein